jgi:hypothetical protein
MSTDEFNGGYGRIHRIILSNGRVLLVEEGNGSLHIASENNLINEVEAYICTINHSGVLVMPNSGDATFHLVEGLHTAERISQLPPIRTE